MAATAVGTLRKGAWNDFDWTCITVQRHRDIKYAECCICDQRMAVDPTFLLEYRNASGVDEVWLAEQVKGQTSYRRRQM